MRSTLLLRSVAIKGSNTNYVAWDIITFLENNINWAYCNSQKITESTSFMTNPKIVLFSSFFCHCSFCWLVIFANCSYSIAAILSTAGCFYTGSSLFAGRNSKALIADADKMFCFFSNLWLVLMKSFAFFSTNRWLAEILSAIQPWFYHNFTQNNNSLFITIKHFRVLIFLLFLQYITVCTIRSQSVNISERETESESLNR